MLAMMPLSHAGDSATGTTLPWWDEDAESC
jgi:hypothetical protein